jgi:spermidine/putrescine transport system permease protein
MKLNLEFRGISLAIIWCWLLVFALLPFCSIVAVSFLTHSSHELVQLPWTLENYRYLFNSAYFVIFEKSLLLAAAATLFSLLLGYPFAYCLARLSGGIKNTLLLLVIIPFWTSSLIRSYALIAILKTKGLLNTWLLSWGIIHHPLSILFTNQAVVIGLVYNLLPFMILPIMTNIEKIDHRLIAAAHDLGANWFTTFTKIILPLTMPGIIAGCILVFLPAMTIFYIPDILGGAKSILLGNLIQNKFLIAQNWPMGSAVSMILTLILIGLVLIYWWTNQESQQPRNTVPRRV